MRNYKAFFFFIIFITMVFVSKAQQQNDSLSQKLDEYLTSANKYYKFNGSALVAQHGKILLQKGYGFKDVSKNIVNDTN